MGTEATNTVISGGTLRSRKIMVTVTLAAGETRVVKVSKKIPYNSNLIGDKIVTITSCCDTDKKVYNYSILDRQ